jgi:hypothetical protein
MKKSILSFLAMCALTGVAQAATTTMSAEIEYVGQHVPNDSYDLVFDKFSTADTATEANRTLTKVTITYNLEWWGGYHALDNDSANPAYGDFEVYSQATLSSTDVYGLPSALRNSRTTYISLAANDGDSTENFDTGGSDYYRWDGPTYETRATRTEASDVVDSGLLAFYAGNGTYTINYESVQGYTESTFGGAARASSPSSAQGYVSIQYTYDYTPIPEPTTFALLGLGGLVIGLRRRFKKR